MSDDTPEQRKLAAIMFTDMVGYSALAQRNEALALELLEEHRRLVRSLLPKHQGEEIETTGDGFLLEFASAVLAVRCAVEIQDVLTQRNAGVSPEQAIRIRIGIHVGDIVRRGPQVFGDGVNIAARIEPLAEPGGICVSQQVFDLVRNKIDTPLVRFGAGELKNIRVPVVIYKVALDARGQPATLRQRASFYWRQKRTRRRVLGLVVVAAVVAAGWTLWSPGNRSSGSWTKEASIAVLPFVNMSADKENEYLGDGFAEELIHALAKIDALRVAARTSSFAFKGRNEDARQIGRELRVRSILEGSVRKATNKLRITVQLIDTATGYHLWSETYDRELTDLFALQREVASSIVDVLQNQSRTGDLWGGLGALRSSLTER